MDDQEKRVFDRYAELYGDVCDIVYRAQMAERGVEITDGFKHTSDGARPVALAIFEALDLQRLLRIEDTVRGLVGEMDPDGSNPWWAEVLIDAGGADGADNEGIGPLTEVEQKVWAEWGRLGRENEEHPSPVKEIARRLGMAPADVAFIVYPAEEFGVWADDQEPDLLGGS